MVYIEKLDYVTVEKSNKKKCRVDQPKPTVLETLYVNPLDSLF